MMAYQSYQRNPKNTNVATDWGDERPFASYFGAQQAGFDPRDPQLLVESHGQWRHLNCQMESASGSCLKDLAARDLAVP
jgi:hypothetical protein